MNKKCTACGSTNLRQVNDLVTEGCNSDGNAKLNGESYICLECGHIEIYSDALLFKARQDEAYEKHIHGLINEVNKEIKDANKKIPILEKEIAILNKEIKQLEVESKNEDITLKQQKELFGQIDAKKEELNQKECDYQNAKSTIGHAPQTIARIKEKGHR